MSVPTSRTRRGRRPDTRADVAVDVAGVAVLTGLALSAFSGTFLGPAWVLTCGVGTLAGLLVALALGRRRPWWLAVPALLLVFAVLGPPLTLRGSSAGPWPTPAAWESMAGTLTGGWRRLLTTLPPLDGSGPLTLLPFVLALVGAATALLLARRTRAAYLPMLVPAGVAVTAAALGVVTPGGVVVRGLALLGAGLVWGTARARRHVVTRTGAPAERLATAGLLLGVVGLLTGGLGGVLGSPDRTVVREHVDPPFTATDRPSPLAAFRAFRPAVGDLADAELLRVTGLPAGTLVRLATVDDYSGTVWAAGEATPTEAGSSGSFLRVGARIPRPPGGEEASARVVVGTQWSDRRELAIWVPTVGDETRIAFTGSGAQDLAGELRYNLDTGAAVLPEGLPPGQEYVLDERIGAPPAAPPATPLVDPALTQPVARLVAAADAAGRPPLEQVRAVGTWLRANGAYSDGGPGEETILPGHSFGRLATFAAASEPAGNDEQYAATLALTAAYVGLPSRVVLGALPGTDGVVRGEDVRAYVEVLTGDGWTLIGPEEFVPDRDKAPSPRAVVEQDRSRAAVVPPPIAQRPPSSEDGFTLEESTSGQGRTAVVEPGLDLPLWAVVSLGVVAVPALGLPLWTLLLLGTKSVRRAVRTRRGSGSRRTVAAWEDALDTLRDAGYEVSSRDTRREVARAVGGSALMDLARAVDVGTYGPDGARAESAERAWSLSRRVRQEQAEGRGRRERWRRAVSLASLLPERSGEPIRVPSGIHAGRLVETRSAG